MVTLIKMHSLIINEGKGATKSHEYEFVKKLAMITIMFVLKALSSTHFMM
jgi:hypothetical protein